MKHYNPSITERANRIFNLKNGDGMSDEIDGPVAVIPIVPVVRICRQLAGGGTFTTPSDRDFYLTNAQISIAKVAADSGALASLTVVIDGVTISILRINGVTLTADAQNVLQSWNFPIKLDRGTNITLSLSGAYTTANALLQGFIEEVART